ncbi:hypothetical protein ON010_g6058 [Phytophthora cinnamomi]|nr:hypothetical protein ON010_g6058 [Phytophthora cinnamomi]
MPPGRKPLNGTGGHKLHQHKNTWVTYEFRLAVINSYENVGIQDTLVPFFPELEGTALDTMMDEKARKSWQLAPSQVSFKNPQWQNGVDQLRETIAGGHFVKHQDMEKEDGMVATLVVQLPSEHEGGDLVVYQGGKDVQRHDFGKGEGSAAFLSHYAVHYADAEHSLEKKHRGLGHSSVEGHRPRQSGSANASLPAKKKMLFYIAAVEPDINYYDTGGSWEGNEREEKINWYSSIGHSYGRGMEEIKMNFLNPGRDSLAELWEGHGNSTFEGYLGNEGATRNTTYPRYAIVAWPAVRSVENALKYIGANAALGALKAQKSIDAATLQSFMTAAADADLVDDEESYSLGYRPKSESVSVQFCETLCDLLVAVRDPALVNLFFTNFFVRLGEKKSVIPSITKVIRAFKWGDIGEGLLSTLDEEIQKNSFGFMGYAGKAGDSGMELALRLVKGLDRGTAQQVLLKAAVEKAVMVHDKRLCSSSVIGWLWMFVIRQGNKAILEPTGTQSQENGAGPTTAIDRDPVAAYGWHRRIQAFLRGPNPATTTMGLMTFTSLPDARKYATKCMRATQTNASFTMEPGGRGKDAFVTIKKTRDWFSQYENSLLSYKDELKDLTERFGQGGCAYGPAVKRARVEWSCRRNELNRSKLTTIQHTHTFLLCASLARKPRLKGLPHTLDLVNDFLLPKTIDSAVYNDLQRVVKTEFSKPWTRKLWKFYGTAENVFTGNEGPIKSTRYSRFAVVAWPVSRHLEIVLNLMSAKLAVEELLSRRPVDAIELRSFPDAVVVRYGLSPFYRGTIKASVRFSRSFCELMLDVGEADLATMFLTNTVGAALLDVLGNQTDVLQFYETPGDSEMELLLQMADAVDDAKARQDLVKMAVEMDLKLQTSKVVDMFWKHVILPGDTEMFKSMTDKVMQKKPSELYPFVQVFSKCVDKRDTTCKFAVLEAIAAYQVSWLEEEFK